ncbi:MAG TPA: DUF882 domain-containing protein [Gammaproteobacteria bacterium]|nr:DUF882 domain-containing protein [Gammaproteobacteria bacterium]
MATIRDDRRAFFKFGLVAAAGCISLPRAARAAVEAGRHERRLAFYNLHTGESFGSPYWIEGRYLPESLAEIDHVLRDFRTNQVKPIATSLLDLLFALRATLSTESFHVISGYRSPATNAMLAGNGSGVARHSLHMAGEAIDIRLPGRDLRAVRSAAIALHGGGVGYYPKSNFIHMDVGRVRTW